MMKLQRIFPTVFALLLIGLCVTSCQKEELDLLQQSDNIVLPEHMNSLSDMLKDEDEDDCFTIVYPITLNFEDSTSTSINSDDELETAVDDWFESQGEDAEDPLPSYPLSVIMSDDNSERLIQNDEDLEDLIIECYGGEDDCEEEDWDDEDWDDEDWDDEDDFDFGECFSFNYPIDFVAEDGSTSTINSDDELDALLDNEEEDYEPVYPFEVTLTEDGSTKTIASEEDLDVLFEDCFGDWDDDDDFGECFSFNYPIDFVAEDGSTSTINSDDELDALLDNEEEDYEPVYPFEVTLTEDGSTKTIASEEDLDILFESCFD